MLEGKEVDQKFDNGAGEAIVDVDAKGGVIVSVAYNKETDLQGWATAKANVGLSVQTNILKIAEKIAAQTSTKWDDELIAGLKTLLGIVD